MPFSTAVPERGAAAGICVFRAGDITAKICGTDHTRANDAHVADEEKRTRCYYVAGLILF